MKTDKIIIIPVIILIFSLAFVFSAPTFRTDTPAPYETENPALSVKAPIESEQPKWQTNKAELSNNIIPTSTPEADNVEFEIVEVQETEEETSSSMEYLGMYYICGYDICVECCGKTDGVTKSGVMAEPGRTIAAPDIFPFGTTLYIDGIGERVVEDRGQLANYVIDVLCENHSECYAITGWYDVYILSENT